MSTNDEYEEYDEDDYYCGILPERDESKTKSICEHCHRPIDSQTCRALCHAAGRRCRRTIMERKWCQEHAGPCMDLYEDYKRWRATAAGYLANDRRLEQLDQYIRSVSSDREALGLLRQEWRKTWTSFRKLSLFRTALAKESALRTKHTRDCFANDLDPGHAHVIHRIDLLVRDLQQNPNLYLISPLTSVSQQSVSRDAASPLVAPLSVASVFSPLHVEQDIEQDIEQEEEEQDEKQEKQEKQGKKTRKKKKKKKQGIKEEEIKAFQEAQSFREEQLAVPKEEWDKALDIIHAEGPESGSDILKLAAEWTLTDPSIEVDTLHINESWPAPSISRENTGTTFMCFDPSKELVVMPTPSRKPQEIGLEIRFKKQRMVYTSHWSEKRYMDIKNADLILQVWIRSQTVTDKNKLQDLLVAQENAYLYLFHYCKQQFTPYNVEVVGIPRQPDIPVSELLDLSQLLPLQSIRTYVQNSRATLQREILALGLAFKEQREEELTPQIQDVLAAAICFLWLQTATFRLMYIPAKIRLADRKKSKK